jgi:hypothetical protein
LSTTGKVNLQTSLHDEKKLVGFGMIMPAEIFIHNGKSQEATVNLIYDDIAVRVRYRRALRGQIDHLQGWITNGFTRICFRGGIHSASLCFDVSGAR